MSIADRMPVRHSEQDLPAVSNSTSRIALGVLAALDRAGLRYCVTHGYLCYSTQITSDVDILVDPGVSAADLAKILHGSRSLTGAEIVSARGCCFILVGLNERAKPISLVLDFAPGCHLDKKGANWTEVILANRRRHEAFWVPSPPHEFILYLTRKILKRSLDELQGARLSQLYAGNPEECDAEIARIWPDKRADLVRHAGATGDWRAVRECLDELATALPRSDRSITALWMTLVDRVQRFMRPDGISLAFLGPDGAGKSSTLAAVSDAWQPAFPHVRKYGFAPGLLHRLLRRPFVPNTKPHSVRPRSRAASLCRALGYWLPNALAGHLLTVRVDLARGGLVLQDRPLIDCVVDPTRYRYSGPASLVRWIWALAPQPDFVFVLDAPPEVLQGRKQEVPFEETARQRLAYLEVARRLPNGEVMDASNPIEANVARISREIVTLVSARNDRRYGALNLRAGN